MFKLSWEMKVTLPILAVIALIFVVNILTARPAHSQDAYHDNGSQNVTVSCMRGQGNRMAGFENVIRIIQNYVVNEQQLYNNDFAVWSGPNAGTCTVMDGSRIAIRTSVGAQHEDTGDVRLLVIQRADRQHLWIVRLRAIEYPAQTYELNRLGHAPRMIQAGFDTAWQPTHIYDSREWTLPRRCADLLRQVPGFQGVLMMELGDRYPDGSVCNRVVRH